MYRRFWIRFAAIRRRMCTRPGIPTGKITWTLRRGNIFRCRTVSGIRRAWPEIGRMLLPEHVFDKPTFGSVDLVERIKEIAGRGEIEVELVGLCTDICVVSNALLLKAYLPETKISVDPACCAGVTPEKHEAALETMRSCQIVVEA